MPRRKVAHPFYQEVGSRLRKRREELGLAMDAVTAKTGIRKGHLSSIESGRVFSRFETYVLLARALDMSLDRLVDGIPIEPREHEQSEGRGSIVIRKRPRVERRRARSVRGLFGVTIALGRRIWRNNAATTGR
jgi:transcriptional regulator with XRE-family HTH domain